jgi:hypothetical protein
MRNRIVAAAGFVRMAFALNIRRAAHRRALGHADPVLVDMAFVRMVQMAFMQIVRMAVVGHRLVPAIFAVLVGMGEMVVLVA